MKQQELIEVFGSLPADAQRQVIDFIAFLRQRYATSSPIQPPRQTDLAKEPFIGMWRDRDDLADSSAWICSIRASEWTKVREQP